MTNTDRTYTIDENGRRHLIADMIEKMGKTLHHPGAVAPTSVVLYVQYVTAEELLSIADGGTDPLEILLHETHASVQIVLADNRQIDFKATMTAMAKDPTELERKNFEEHNRECLVAPDAHEPVATQPTPPAAAVTHPGYL